MKRFLILLLPLCLWATAAAAESIIIDMQQNEALLGLPYRMEHEYVLTVEKFAFEPCETEGKQKMSVKVYYKNLSADTVELSENCALKVIFRDRFELPLTFETYTHVRAEVNAAAPFPVEPLVEIYGTWSGELPDAIANAGEGELRLEWTFMDETCSVQLR